MELLISFLDDIVLFAVRTYNVMYHYIITHDYLVALSDCFIRIICRQRFRLI